MKPLKLLSLLLLVGMGVKGQGNKVQWIATKTFKPYYFPGDYEVYVIKQPGMQDPNIAHDTIYIDSCRLMREAEQKRIDSIVQHSTASTGIGWVLDTSRVSMITVDNVGRVYTVPSRNERIYVYKKGKNIYRKGRNTTKYITRWHNSQPHKVVNKKKYVAPAKPAEIMIQATYFLKGKKVSVRYFKEYGLDIKNYGTPVQRYITSGTKKIYIDSMHFVISLP